jgi:hypothetical protein
MASELIIRFLAGGVIVSLFAILGQLWRPKTFAGLFGAAPSVAIVSLTLASVTSGREYTTIEARSMALGACAMFVYCTVCVRLTKVARLPVWLEAGLSWLSWFGGCAVLGIGLEFWGSR